MPQPLPLSAERSILVISDRLDGWPIREGGSPARVDAAAGWDWHRDPGSAQPVEVTGGYLERLPLSLIACGAYDCAEIWWHWQGSEPPPRQRRHDRLAYRAFDVDGPQAPFASAAMIEHLRRHGAPHLLVVYGLGVDEALLAACGNSVIVYNSIDAPALRVPDEVACRFDLVLTGAEWQSREVATRVPGMATMVSPVGPDFAGLDQFRPLGVPKHWDAIYVAAAQPYKRHDIMFEMFAELGEGYRGLCVFGYGELADAYRDEIAARGLSIDCIGPPGVAAEEVNLLVNQSRIALVCGEHDGAPAIITESMLADVPVLANEALVCGRQYIMPATGRTAAPVDFARTCRDMLRHPEHFDPRAAILPICGWPVTAPALLTKIKHLAAERKRS